MKSIKARKVWEDDGFVRKQSEDVGSEVEKTLTGDISKASDMKEGKPGSTDASKTDNMDAGPSDSVRTSSSQPLPSYIALISKVILSSPSQKLNLASIYAAMEERFPYLRSRGPGWRNSVRHNLSVNECFVKVSRCEDGRGHYWGVHRAHLRDFQLGNYRLSRGRSRARHGREGEERRAEAAGGWAWMESSCFMGRLYRSSCAEPQCPLQDPKSNQSSSLDRTPSLYQPWAVNLDWDGSSGWMRRCYVPDGFSQGCRPLTSAAHCWELNHPAPAAMMESYDGRFMTPLRFPGCCCCGCTTPILKELRRPQPYQVSFYFHPSARNL